MDDWLARTREIQTNTYGKDPADLQGDEWAEFLRWNILAAHAELTEALEETRWKPWASSEGPVVPNRRAFISEIVDAQMFLANALVSAEVTDEEYAEVYRAKWAKNIERQERAGGYQSRRGIDKCVNCGRSFDDVGKGFDHEDICTICETRVA